MNSRIVFLVLLFAGYAERGTAQQAVWELATGDTYVFRGPVVYPSGDSARMDTLVWTMRVESTAKQGDTVAWLVSGVPVQLANYMPGASIENMTIVRIGAKYYLSGKETFERLIGNQSGETPLVDDSQCFLDFPLYGGKQIGEADMLARGDGMYVWLVESLPDAVTVPEGRDAERHAMHSVTYRALNSIIMLVYQEGFGIVRYYYHHNGSPGEFDMRCISKQSGG